MFEHNVISEAVQANGQSNHNATALLHEMEWFTAVVNARLSSYFQDGKNGNGMHNVMPDLTGDPSVYAEFVNYYQLSRDERLLLMLAIIPHVQPHLLDVFFMVNPSLGRGYTEFGGIKANRHSGFLPTVETAFFILAGNDLGRRFQVQRLFEPDHIFSGHNILHFDQDGAGEPFSSGSLRISEEYLDFFTTGHYRKPQFSQDFPARRLTTSMDWTDLVVDEFTAQQLDELRVWLKYGKVLATDWGMQKKLKPGYKVLFHGPPGTGKTLTASLLGKLYHLDVYRVDLSTVISKYIGETEKNLENVFRKAENKNWILFFDEADALFGKRTNISDAHDRYANQEIAYLLQRLEDYAGLVILASNMRSNVDEAFTRRLQSIIHFPKPQEKERLRIWNNAFSPKCEIPPPEEMQRIAHLYELSGGAIMNVVQSASLQALNREDNRISLDDLLQGIKKEFRKEGKTI
ncbi:ATP-binding protein [Flavihumibacter solisilvae]|uniref:ATP-binding protein n=1 Tax=Flavihumibacter solisilvae TaxID=1349421 RepID=UPI000692601F|nr:ATP-binding protein [Flavihumibacter solisilvae]